MKKEKKGYLKVFCSRAFLFQDFNFELMFPRLKKRKKATLKFFAVVRFYFKISISSLCSLGWGLNTKLKYLIKVFRVNKLKIPFSNFYLPLKFRFGLEF